MVHSVNNLQFELSTGILYADQHYIDRAEAELPPRNLVQLLALGKLMVIGSSEASQEEAEQREIVPLPELLLDEQYEGIKIPTRDRLDTRTWDTDDFLGYGLWLDDLTRDPERVKTELSREVIKRAYHVGLGPSNSRIERKERFGTMTGFYDALHVVPNHQLYKYDEWSRQQLADYAEGVFRDLQSAAKEQNGKSLRLNDEIERRADVGLGPALWVFKRNGGGGVMKHMAMNGYADPKNMQPEDYIQLGVRFTRANGGKTPTVSAIDFLSLSRRAPSSHAVWGKFAWPEYIEKVKAAYEKQEAYRKRSLTQKLLTIKQELDDGTLPRSLIKDAPAMEMIARRAKWQLLGRLLPHLNPSPKQAIAQHTDPDDFIEAVRSHKHIDISDIQQTAEILGVCGDIWRDDAYMDYLRVPDELLTWGSSSYLARQFSAKAKDH